MHQRKIDRIKSYLAEQFKLPGEQIELMLPSFLTTLTTHLQKLEQALAQNDPATIGRAGHTIKGALMNLGLENGARIARRIEERGKAGDCSADYRQLVEELRLEIEAGRD